MGLGAETWWPLVPVRRPWPAAVPPAAAPMCAARHVGPSVVAGAATQAPLGCFQADLRVEILLIDADGDVHQLAGTAGNPQPARTRALI